jgi:hypothetical protein
MIKWAAQTDRESSVICNEIRAGCEREPRLKVMSGVYVCEWSFKMNGGNEGNDKWSAHK